MPYVVMDTSVSLPATLSPGGMARKLWLLLALGALTYQIEHHRLALEELQAEGEVMGARSGALDSIEAEARAAELRRAALRDLLPHGTPEHWVAVGGGEASGAVSSVSGGRLGKAPYFASTVLGGLEEMTEAEFASYAVVGARSGSGGGLCVAARTATHLGCPGMSPC